MRIQTVIKKMNLFMNYLSTSSYSVYNGCVYWMAYFLLSVKVLSVCFRSLTTQLELQNGK